MFASAFYAADNPLVGTLASAGMRVSARGPVEPEDSSGVSRHRPLLGTDLIGGNDRHGRNPADEAARRTSGFRNCSGAAQ